MIDQIDESNRFEMLAIASIL